MRPLSIGPRRVGSPVLAPLLLVGVLALSGGCKKADDAAKACKKAAESEMVRVAVAGHEPFDIDRFAVRADAYMCCVRAGACGRKTALMGPGGACNLGVEARADHPANCVEHRGAEQLCRWLGRRLPTEQERVLAATGGTEHAYPWGDRFAPGKANCDEGVCKDGHAGTAPVTAFAASAAPTGAVQLAGNVFEWTATWYASPAGTPDDLRAPAKTFRVLKGGSWREHAWSLRNDASHYLKADVRSSNIGFRCAR